MSESPELYDFSDPQVDVREFGVDTWVYCGQHMRPHTTGWCTVWVRDKTRLEAKNYEDAIAECRRRRLPLYSDRFSDQPEGEP